VNRRGSSAQHASNCSAVMNRAQDSERAFPVPHFALPAATPASTLTRLVRDGLPGLAALLRGLGLELVGAVA
jgi:hypothetical protein